MSDTLGAVARDQPSRRTRDWLCLAFVLSGIVVAALDFTVLTVGVPTIKEDFGTSTRAVQWVQVGHVIVLATCLIPGGRLADMYGARRIFMVGLGLFAVGDIVAAGAQNVATLIVGKSILQGLGTSMLMPSSLSLLSTIFRGERRAAAFAMWGAASGASIAFGPVVGGVLTTWYSWRVAFEVMAVLAVVAALGVRLFVTNTTTHQRDVELDIVGALLVGGSLFPLVVAVTQGSSLGWGRPLEPFRLHGTEVWPATAPLSLPLVCVLVAVGVAAILFVHERRRERADRSTIVDFKLFSNTRYRYGLLALVTLQFGQLASVVLLPVIIQDSLHLTAAQAGAWLLPSGLAIAVGAQLGGRLSKKIDLRLVSRLGLMILSIGLLVMSLALTRHTSQFEFALMSSISGLGAGLTNSPLTSLVLLDVPLSGVGAASGMNSVARQIGGALGIAASSAILAQQALAATTRFVESAAPASSRTRLLESIRRDGPHGLDLTGVQSRLRLDLQRGFDDAVLAGARPALLLAAFVVLLGVATTYMIPRTTLGPSHRPPLGDSQLSETGSSTLKLTG